MSSVAIKLYSLLCFYRFNLSDVTFLKFFKRLFIVATNLKRILNVVTGRPAYVNTYRNGHFSSFAKSLKDVFLYFQFNKIAHIFELIYFYLKCQSEQLTLIVIQFDEIMLMLSFDLLAGKKYGSVLF